MNWQKNGWKNSQRKPVANRDLWEPFVELYEARAGEITFQWVKGHSDDPMNDLVDRLAVQACVTQQPAAGDHPPDPATLGPPDAPRARSAAATAAPAKRRRARARRSPPRPRSGPRRPSWAGGRRTPWPTDVRRRLAELFAAKATLHPDLVVLTGLRLGAECWRRRRPSTPRCPTWRCCRTPSPTGRGPRTTAAGSPSWSRRPASVVTLEKKRPESRADFRNALARRDGWLAANVHEAVLVWDGDDRSLAELHRKLVKRLGEEEVWVLAP